MAKIKLIKAKWNLELNPHMNVYKTPEFYCFEFIDDRGRDKISIINDTHDSLDNIIVFERILVDEETIKEIILTEKDGWLKEKKLKDFTTAEREE